MRDYYKEPPTCAKICRIRYKDFQNFNTNVTYRKYLSKLKQPTVEALIGNYLVLKLAFKAYKSRTVTTLLFTVLIFQVVIIILCSQYWGCPDLHITLRVTDIKINSSGTMAQMSPLLLLYCFCICCYCLMVFEPVKAFVRHV